MTSTLRIFRNVDTIVGVDQAIREHFGICHLC